MDNLALSTFSKVHFCKVHVKKPTILLNTYYFTSIFQGISLLLNFN